MSKRKGLQANQAGIAVVVALLVLALLSLLGVTLMGLSVTESQIGSNESDLKKAFFAAEAGIQEAMYRMRLDPADPPTRTDEGDTPCTATADPVVVGKLGTPTTAWANPTDPAFWQYNPPTCAWTYSGSSAAGWGNYFGGTAGNLDSAGRTFNSSASAHIAGGALINANLTNGGSYTVTVAPVVGFVGGCWQYVDQVGAPLGSCAAVGINPALKVTSTGAARDARKVLSTMIRRFNVTPNPDAPLTANSDVEVTSASAVVDGRNYDCDGNNPTNTDSKPAVAAPPKPPPNETEPDIDINNPDNLVCAAGTGVSDCGTIRTPFPS
ncbi:MAG: PilX N-terminal domain-containing pilus assembly protein, partial [Candidatus Methylomirabilis sp.]